MNTPNVTIHFNAPIGQYVESQHVETMNVIPPSPLDPIKVAPPREDTPKRYAVTAQWLQQEKAAGRDYLKDTGYNYQTLAEKLSNIFGWPVERGPLYNAVIRCGLLTP